MIISHPLKIIFLKTTKVGGTSFEIALSKFCGEDCVITPISPNDEETRKQLGFRTAQNFLNTKWYYHAGGDKTVFAETSGEFFNHIRAADVQRMVPWQVWSGYLIVSTVRSPFDVIVSKYFWALPGQPNVTFEKFVEANPHLLDENVAITHIGKKSAVEFYLRYENLQEDITKLEDQIGQKGIWEQFRTINAKGDKRPKTGASVAEMFASAPKAYEMVKSRCAYEIEKFGYSLPSR